MGLAIQELKLLPPEIGVLAGFDLSLLATDENFGTEFKLNNGEKSPLEQITFTLSKEHADEIKEALTMAQDESDGLEYFGNENKHGNAIYTIVREWIEQRK